MASVRYFGGLWMTFNEQLQGQISARLQRTYICIIYTSHRMILYMRTGQNVKKRPKSDLKGPPVTLKLKVKVTKQ